MQLVELHRIKQWHVAHHKTHPVEYQAWDVALMFWVMGWVGWIPAYAFGAVWVTPLCLLGMCAPGLYSAWRGRMHRLRRLRCDWLPPGARSLARGSDVRR